MLRQSLYARKAKSLLILGQMKYYKINYFIMQKVRTPLMDASDVIVFFSSAYGREIGPKLI